MADFLHWQGSGRDRWLPPTSDGTSPEAEWGFADPLAEDIAAFTEKQGLAVVRQSLVHRREVRDHAGNAGGGEGAQNRHAGDDKPEFAALGHGTLVPAHQYVEPGSIAEQGIGKVHHERGMTVRSRSEQGHPQRLGVGYVDLLGRRHDGNTPDEGERVRSIRHLTLLLACVRVPECRTAGMRCRMPGKRGRKPGTGCLVNRCGALTPRNRRG